MQAKLDELVQEKAARMAFTALRRLRKDVQLALYDDEHHGPTHWTRATSLDVLSARSLGLIVSCVLIGSPRFPCSMKPAHLPRTACQVGADAT